MKKLVFFCFLIALSTIAGITLLLFRYDYDAQKIHRVDRLTGKFEIFCLWSQNWSAMENCNSQSNARSAKDTALSTPPTEKPVQDFWYCKEQYEDRKRVETERALGKFTAADEKLPWNAARQWLKADWTIEACLKFRPWDQNRRYP